MRQAAIGVGGSTLFFPSVPSFKVLSPLSELEGCERWRRQSGGQGPQDRREGGSRDALYPYGGSQTGLGVTGDGCGCLHESGAGAAPNE